MNRQIERLSEDFVARFARDLYHCSSCNYCVDAVWPERGMSAVCATMEQHTRAPGYSGRGYIEAARAILEGQALDGAALGERVFTCTTCGNCESACPIGLRPASIGRALREELLAADCVPAPIARAHQAFIEHGNPYGVACAQRHAWANEISVADVASGALLFVGCAAALTAPDEARASLALLRQAGVEASIAATGCCGAPLAELGFAREAEALAHAAATQLAGRKVVMVGAECRRQLHSPNGVEAQSFAAWLCTAVATGKLGIGWKNGVERPAVVSLIESCQLKLGGPAGEEQAAAQLFSALGIASGNPRYPNLHASCCGAAGGMPTMQPAAAARMAGARLPAAGLAVTLDPRCAAHLRASAGEGQTVLGFARFIDTYFTLTPQVGS